MTRHFNIIAFFFFLFMAGGSDAQCPTDFVRIVGSLNPLCDSTQLDWASWSTVNATSGVGIISSNLSVTVTKPSGGLSTTGGMFSGGVFPTQYNVPVNSTALRNDLAGIFTFCFSQPIINPQIALASVGNGNSSVPVITSAPYTIIWAGQGMTYPNDTTFVGTEGYTIIMFPGTFTCISFNYLASESYCNLAFGVLDTNCQTFSIPPICPGSPDTLRGAGAASYTWAPAATLNTTTGSMVIATPLATTTYYVTGTDANNCTATDSFTVNVLPAYNDTAFAGICPGGSYGFEGANYTAAGDYSAVYQTVNHCDSILTLHLVINPIYYDTTVAAICDGVTYTFEGNNYTTTGNHGFNYTTINGCDSVLTLVLTVNPVYNDTLNDTICQGNNYSLGGNTYSTTGSYTLSYQTVNGCDSVITLNLTVNPVYSDTIIDTICQGGNISIGGNTYSTSGSYTLSYQTVNGCDSIVTLKLTVNPAYSDTFTQNICAGNSYSFNGNSYNQTGYYVAVYQTANGCDSFSTLHLLVNPIYNDTIATGICAGSNYSFEGTSYTLAGIHTFNYSTVSGCDSIRTLVLSVNPVYSDSFAVAICNGTSYNLPDGTPASNAGTYNTHLTTVNGCDSVITTLLQVYPTYNQTHTDTVCPKQSYLLSDGSTVTGGGVYVTTLSTVNSCDSVIRTQLIVDSEPDWFHASITPATVTVDLGKTITLTANTNQSGQLTYGWTPGVGLSCADCATPEFSGNYSTSYTMVVSDTNGCEAHATVDLKVVPDYSVFIPNVFTPNGDGNNDRWQIFGNKSAMKQLSVMLLNRIGEKIFESNDINFDWDGYYLGKPAPPGVYVYVITIVWLDNVTSKTYKGTMTLIR